MERKNKNQRIEQLVTATIYFFLLSFLVLLLNLGSLQDGLLLSKTIFGITLIIGICLIILSFFRFNRIN